MKVLKNLLSNLQFDATSTSLARQIVLQKRVGSRNIAECTLFLLQRQRIAYFDTTINSLHETRGKANSSPYAYLVTILTNMQMEIR